jgi:hypothetical protein
LLADEPNATNRPSALIDGHALRLLASVPALDTLTRTICDEAGAAISSRPAVTTR